MLSLPVETVDVASLPATSNVTATSNLTTILNLSLNLKTLLMLAWAMVVSLLGLRFLYREIRFRRKLKSATCLAENANQDLKIDFETLAKSAGVHRTVRIMCSEVALSVLGPRKSCQRRLQRMLDNDRRINPGIGWISICGLLLTAVVTLPQLSAASPQELTAESSGLLAGTKTVGDPADTWRFDLSVIDTEGKAVPNATVFVDGGNTPASNQIRIGKYIKTSREGDAFVCNNQGKLSIDFPAKPKQLQILFEMDGYGPYLARWVHPSRVNLIPHEFTVQVEHAWTVGGTVIDEDGNPVKGADVSCYIPYKRRSGGLSLRGKVNEVKTNEEGRWLFRQVPNSLYAVDDARVNHPAFQLGTLKLARPEFEIPQGGGDQSGGTITLTKGLTVSGRIVDEQGRPIVGATVRTLAAFDERRAISGEDGRYTIVGCQPKTLDVVATSPGMAIELNRVTIEPNSKDVDFLLNPSKGIRVRFVDEAGKPLAGLRILPVTWRGLSTTHWALNEILFNRFADENGVWEWKEAPLDEVAVSVGSPQSAWEETPLGDDNVMRTPLPEVLSGIRTLLARQAEYVITVPTKRFVSGEVTDAVTGEKIKSFRVVPGRIVEERRIWLGWRAIIGSGGTYRIPYTRRLDVEFIRIEANGYRSAVSRDIESDEGEVTLDFKLEPAEMTATQVVDAEDQPVSGADVVYATEESRLTIRNGHLSSYLGSENSLQLLTDDQGKVEFTTRLDPFQLLILHDRGFARVASENMTVPQQIKLTEWSVLEGNYLVGQEPARGIEVLVEAKGLEVRSNGRKGVPNIYVRYSGKTNGSGDFRFDRVVPGSNYVGHKKFAGESHRSGVFKKYVAVAGETQKLQLGEKGVSIAGRMLPPKVYNGSKIFMNAKLLLSPQKSTGDTGESNSNIFFKVTAREDGSFRIDDVPAGDWILTSSHRVRIGPDLVSIGSDPVKISVAPNDPSEKDVGDLLTKEKSRRKRPKRLGD